MGWANKGWADTLRRLAGSQPRWPVIATADYYFLGGVGDLVGADGVASHGRPIERIGPNSWTCDDRLVIVRYATAQEMSRIEDRRWRSVHYIIDDLLPAAAESAELPPDYRQKLSRFSATLLPRILALNPIIVAPSDHILEYFPAFDRRRLDPCCLALRDQQGLPPPTTWDGSLRIAFLGSRSHAGTLPLLDVMALRLARTCPQATLHLFFGRHLPTSMARRDNVVNNPPVAWSQFQAFCRRTPFHIGLAPVLDTAFGKARSITKIMDHAAVGAVGLYSDREPFKQVIEHGRAGLLVADGADAWTAAILDLVASPASAQAMARAGAALASDLGDPLRVRRFWLSELGIGGGSAGRAGVGNQDAFDRH